MSQQLTIRGVPDEIARRLRELSHASGQSLNATVNQVLAQGVGESERSRLLERYSTWSAEGLEDFTAALTLQRTVDADLWR